jgi:tRNA dimethylallyltransferase
MRRTSPLLITVLGPTASGKTAFAARLAGMTGGEIISADSRQVYRNMDIGTGKDYGDYHTDAGAIKYHLIDIVEAGYKYSLFEYQRDFLKAWEDITGRGKQPVLCGGSGMYIESVLKGYNLINVPHNEELRGELRSKSDSELAAILSSCRKLHNVSDTSSRKRLIRAIEIEIFTAGNRESLTSFPAIESVILGIAPGRDLRRRRITSRLEARLQEGLTEEVRQLLDRGISPDDLIFYGLEYKYITLYLTGRLGYNEMKDRLETAIFQFAKRQMTWFRKMERNGFKIHWLDPELPVEINIDMALEIIRQHGYDGQS